MPMRLPDLQATPQSRWLPSTSSAKLSGTPTVLGNWMQAPLSDRLRTLQSITQLLWLNTIFADFNTR